MAKAEGVTEALKVAAPMAWVGRMNNICNRAMEIVNAEIMGRQNDRCRLKTKRLPLCSIGNYHNSLSKLCKRQDSDLYFEEVRNIM